MFGDNRLQRAEHSTALSAEEDKIYIFGGVDKDFNLSSALQRLDLFPEKEEEMVAKKIKSGLYVKM